MSQHFRIEPLTGIEASAKCIKVYTKDKGNLPLEIDVSNRFCVLSAQGEKYLDRFRNFKVRKDDVWVVTMPKCGTTWMLELVWLLQNNLDYASGLAADQLDRCPFLDYSTLTPPNMPDSIDAAENVKPPRVIKSHLPMHLLPKELWTVKPKIIYVARDPKDAAVSFYHFMSGLGRIRGSAEDFADSVLQDRIFYSPFWLHVVEFWKLRNEPYIYFTSFERMKKDLRSVVLQVCEFLQKPVNEEQLETLLLHLSFEKMRDNPTCNHLKELNEFQNYYDNEGNPFRFMRKGVIGSYKDDFKEDTIKRFEEWTSRALKPYEVTAEEILYS